MQDAQVGWLHRSRGGHPRHADGQRSNGGIFGEATDTGELPYTVLIDLWERYLAGVE